MEPLEGEAGARVLRRGSRHWGRRRSPVPGQGRRMRYGSSARPRSPQAVNFVDGGAPPLLPPAHDDYGAPPRLLPASPAPPPPDSGAATRHRGFDALPAVSFTRDAAYDDVVGHTRRVRSGSPAYHAYQGAHARPLSPVGTGSEAGDPAARRGAPSPYASYLDAAALHWSVADGDGEAGSGSDDAHLFTEADEEEAEREVEEAEEGSVWGRAAPRAAAPLNPLPEHVPQQGLDALPLYAARPRTRHSHRRGGVEVGRELHFPDPAAPVSRAAAGGDGDVELVLLGGQEQARAGTGVQVVCPSGAAFEVYPCWALDRVGDVVAAAEVILGVFTGVARTPALGMQTAHGALCRDERHMLHEYCSAGDVLHILPAQGQHLRPPSTTELEVLLREADVGNVAACRCAVTTSRLVGYVSPGLDALLAALLSGVAEVAATEEGVELLCALVATYCITDYLLDTEYAMRGVDIGACLLSAPRFLPLLRALLCDASEAQLLLLLAKIVRAGARGVDRSVLIPAVTCISAACDCRILQRFEGFALKPL